MEFDISRLSDVAAERSILGAILLENEKLYQCSNLQPEDFFLGTHRHIFKAMRELGSNGMSIDPILVMNYLNAQTEVRWKDNAPITIQILSGLLDGIVPGSLESRIDLVHGFGIRRRFVAQCYQSINTALDLSERTEDCISILHDRILSLAGDGPSQSLRLKDFSFDVYAEIERLAKSDPNAIIGLTTGVKRVDDVTTGLRPGEYWILGSWTGSGKTAFVTQIITANAKRHVPALWFTQEMTKRQVMLRMIPQLTEGHVKARDLRDPRNMSAAQLELFKRTQAVIDQWPLFVNDATSMEIVQLVAHAQMMVRREKIELIAVDYIQLLQSKGARSRTERVSQVSAGLRELAKSTGVPVIAVSQLSRPDDKKLRAPRPFDLKESGDVENDAHCIIMPYRPVDRDGKFSHEDVIVIGKQREGPTGTVKVEFDTRTLTFEPRGEDGMNEQLF